MGCLGHLRVCGLRVSGPPGEEIYRKGGYSLYEVDGEEHKVGSFFAPSLQIDLGNIDLSVCSSSVPWRSIDWNCGYLH
jgi:hypothetical protein